MGIRSTRYLDRSVAENRILEIDALLANKMFKDLDGATYEYDYNLEDFVKTNEPLFITREAIDHWTDTMIEDQLDKPFYRFSMFDNYILDKPV